MRKLALCVLATATTLGVFSVPAVADDTECELGLPPGIYDNVVVPEGGQCALSNSIIRGNVKVLRGGVFFSQNNRIAGNFQGDRPQWVGSLGDTIGGNFSVTGATGSPGFLFQGLSVNVFVCGTTMLNGNISVKKSLTGTIAVGSLLPECQGNDVANGNVKVEENFIPPSELLAVARNTVGGNVQVFKNHGPGQKNVVENVVRGNLQCRRNDQPFLGGPNFAGKAEGQCFLGP